MSKPIITVLPCTIALTARFWVNFRCPVSGWLMVKNLHPGATIRMHWDESGNDNVSFLSILPLHSKPFQVDEGDIVWVSSPVSGSRVQFEVAKYKPVADEFGMPGDAATGNVAYSASAIAVTTTYDATTLTKGYGTYFQVSCDAGGFDGTLEWSADNGATYSSPVVLNSADPLKKVFEDNIIFTHLRVAVNAGTFTVYYR